MTKKNKHLEAVRRLVERLLADPMLFVEYRQQTAAAYEPARLPMHVQPTGRIVLILEGTPQEIARKDPAAVTLGTRGGRAKSEAKTNAARKNAKKGGWPKGRKRKADPA